MARIPRYSSGPVMSTTADGVTSRQLAVFAAEVLALETWAAANVASFQKGFAEFQSPTFSGSIGDEETTPLRL
ncbi:hypothetical protein AHiyo1_48650 [Arthrobacter sp. Hiyo1]|nr:hypothetical protein AHiyo1_48650 [Arthrobacter sp. Hiyo1]